MASREARLAAIRRATRIVRSPDSPGWVRRAVEAQRTIDACGITEEEIAEAENA